MGRVMRLANTEVEDIQISYTDEYWFGDLLKKGNKMMLINKETIEKERNARLQDYLDLAPSTVDSPEIIRYKGELDKLTALIDTSEGKIDDASMSDLIRQRIVLRERIGEWI